MLPRNILINACIAILSLSCVIKFAIILWIYHQRDLKDRKYSYLGTDYPEVWDIKRDPVLLQFDNPKHFRLDQADGAAEWNAVVPGDGIVYLGQYRQPFGVAMFHQLRCLDIIRAEMVQPRNMSFGHSPRRNPLARHCLNYIRQMVMCHGDLELESFQFASHINPINWRGVYECRDWEAVYQEVKKNQKEHRNWLAKTV